MGDFNEVRNLMQIITLLLAAGVTIYRTRFEIRVDGIEILIPEPEVGIDHNWVAGFGFLEVGFVRNLEFGF